MRFLKEYNENMLGQPVMVVVDKPGVSKHKDFKLGLILNGKLLSEVDWQIGCPIFEYYGCHLGLGYECSLIEPEV